MNPIDFCSENVAQGNFETGDETTKVNEIDFLENISITPNPVLGGKAFLEFQSDRAESLEIQIINSNGKIIQIANNQLIKTGINKFELNLGRFQSGLYFLKLKISKQISTRKFLIQ